MSESNRALFGLGGLHRIISRKQRHRLVCHAHELGFRSFDVAPAYGNGLNELELGRALKLHRNQIAVTTKFGIPIDLYGERWPGWFPLVRATRKYLAAGYGADYRLREFTGSKMTESLEGSLRRLQRECVDRFLIHEPLHELDPDLFESLAHTAETLKRQGKIRTFGVAGSAPCVYTIARHPSIDVVQTCLSDALARIEGSPQRLVAYNVYRGFERQRTDGTQSFSEFVSLQLSNQKNLEVILASTSMRTVSNFAFLFK
jgi:aryl-alcohol dehydrogenase-like predicted oxidoreductase